jgi:hypothetical protein
MTTEERGSLKSASYQLAPIFGMTADGVYERQRELVRAGILQQESGKGPGSGARLNTHNLAWLVVSLMVTDSLSELRQSMEGMVHASSYQEELCAVLGGGSAPCGFKVYRRVGEMHICRSIGPESIERIRNLLMVSP